MRTTLKLALLASSALFAAPAFAQTQPTPPEHYTNDPRGVDLVTGAFTYQTTDLVVGDPAQGGLVHGRVWANGGWRDTLAGTIQVQGTVYTVSLGGASEVFTESGSTFIPRTNRGMTLAYSGGGLVFTTTDGTQATFTLEYANWISPYAARNGVVSRVKRPNGDELTYHWRSIVYCQRPAAGPPGPECDQQLNAVRLEAVSNNRGYQINFRYASNSPYGPRQSLDGGWLKRTGAIGVNLGEVYCAPGANTCPGATSPSVTYVSANYGGTITSVTDQSGRTTAYGYLGSALTSIRLPGSTSDDVVISYAAGKVTSVSGASGLWTYAYEDAGTTRATTATGPLSQSVIVVSSLLTGRAASIKNALGHTTRFEHDAQGRLKKVTQPEGGYAELTYDARGNVTQTLHVAKPSSGLPNISTSVAYPASCANPVTCNLPTSTTDARGGITDYAYDPVHGGVTQITLPAPTAGATRPQARIAYAPQTAWYKNASGVLAAATSSVTLPVLTSECVTGSSCAGTANEVKTSIIYGASGVANNLLPTMTTTGAGDGSLSATTTLAYTVNGDVASVDGPLPGAADTTSFRYDNMRRLIGAISPDPDTGGSLLHRAQRRTYNDRGQVALAETGTVNGLSDGDWAAFSSLQQVSIAYDAFGRPTHRRSQAGGATHAVQQVSYDAAGRVDCTVTRMNPATYNALPASACDPGAAGSYGPDRIVRSAYDAAGQLTSTTSGLGVDPITESVAYSADGQPVSLTDGRGNVSIIEYDGFDRAVKVRYPEATGGVASTTDYEQYTYDAAGNALTRRNRGGDSVAYTYDALNRVTLADATAANDVGYTYDNLGRTLTTYGGGQTLSFTYDALGRRTSETGPQGTMTSGFDLAGRRTRLTWPDGFHVAYDYNVAGDLTAIRENGATDWQLTSWAYDNLGRRTGQGRANGAYTYWTYDAAGRLGQLTHDLPGTAQDQALNFTYNPAGQILSRTMSNTAYAHTPGAGTTTYVNNGKNQVTNVGGSAVGYDARQNIAAAPMGTYGYNGLNQLTSASAGSGALSLSYDPAGRLFQSAGGATYRFLYDGAQMVGEYDASGNLQRRFIPGLGMDEHVLTYEGAGVADRRWMMQDERRSVVAYTNGSGATLSINTYDEYGQPGAGNAGRFQYTGQMWLPEAQLYHYRARAYAPQLGRFMQTDPIGYGDGANLYAYVGADPMNSSDPWGLQACQPTVVGSTCVGDVIVTSPKPGCRPGETELVMSGISYCGGGVPSFPQTPIGEQIRGGPTGPILQAPPTRPTCATAAYGETIEAFPGGRSTARTGSEAARLAGETQDYSRQLSGQARGRNGRYASGTAGLRGNGAWNAGGRPMTGGRGAAGGRLAAMVPQVSVTLTFRDAVGDQEAPNQSMGTIGGAAVINLPSDTYWDIGIGIGAPEENTKAQVTVCRDLL